MLPVTHGAGNQKPITNNNDNNKGNENRKLTYQ